MHKRTRARTIHGTVALMATPNNKCFLFRWKVNMKSTVNECAISSIQCAICCLYLVVCLFAITTYLAAVNDFIAIVFTFMRSNEENQFIFLQKVVCDIGTEISACAT